MVTKPEMEILLRQVDPVPDQPSDDVSAALLTSVLERRDEMTRTDLPASVQESAPQPSRTRRYAWAFGGALAMMLIAIGIVVVFIAGSGDEAAGPTTVPGIETPSEGIWRRTVIEPAFVTSALRATSLGLIAVGDGIWIAEDGANWRQAFAGPFEPFTGTTTTPAPPLTVPPPLPQVHSVVDAVVEFDSTIYAFGSVFRNENSDQSASQVVVWSSGDGITWEEIVVEDSSPPIDGLRVATAIASEDMIAAYEHGGSRILYSSDGTGWTILETADTGLDGVGLTGISRFEDRYFAVGESHPFGEESGYGIRAVYASTDGLHFTKVPGSEFDENLFPSTLVDHDGVMFVGGFEFVPDGYLAPALWRSPNGSAWERIPIPPATTPGSSNVEELISTDTGLLVVVGERDWGEGARLIPYRTTDGRTLEELTAEVGELEQLAEVEGTRFENQLILMGREHCSLECDPARPLIQLTWTP